MSNTVEPTSESLPYDADDARWVWQEVARVLSLHRELASLYRAKSKDKRTISTLWSRIEEGEYALAAVGVYL